MTTPAIVYDNIVISEQNANSGLLGRVLIENKGHIRDFFENTFNAKFDRRYDSEEGQILLVFQTPENNVEKVKAGFDAVLQIMKNENDTFITSLMVRKAAEKVYGAFPANNNEKKMSNNDKIKAATSSFNKNAPKKDRTPSRNDGKAKNNFQGAKPSGGGRSRDRFSNGFDAPNPNELLRDLRNSYNYQFQPKSDAQADLYKQIDENFITFAIGPAGTGKTHIEVAKAVEALVKGDVEKIILSRPIIQNGKDMGALPGGIREKLGPFLIPLYDELNEVIKNAELVDQLIESGIIEIGPLETTRGRTFKNAYAILDEAQNATMGQTIMFMTRFGQGSKGVLAGDPDQCDLPQGQISGLEPYSESLKNTPGIGYTLFTDKDIFRHEIVARIIQVTANDPKIQALLKKEQKKSPSGPGNN